MSVGEKDLENNPANDPADGAAQGPEAGGGDNGAAEPAVEPQVEPLFPASEPIEPAVELTPEQREIAELQAQLEQARVAQEQSTARLRAVSKAYTDLQSEMKSFKERMEHRAKLDSELLAFEQVKAFFEPVMNLRRSLGASGDEEALRAGLRMVEHQFMEALHKLGLSEVPGEGAKFDPNVHEALGVTPVADPAQDGVVLVVHTTGYAVGTRVLQAAQVVIGKFEEAAGEA
jgi:molecular chaperone GrpE